MTVDSLVFTKSQRAWLKKLREDATLEEKAFVAIRAAMRRDPEFARVVNTIVLERNSELRPIEVTPEQAHKGLAWLKNLAWTPTGRHRKHDPFGYRERAIILQAEKAGPRFTLDEFRDVGTLYSHFYLPVWRLHYGGASFSYMTRNGDGLVLTASW